MNSSPDQAAAALLTRDFERKEDHEKALPAQEPNPREESTIRSPPSHITPSQTYARENAKDLEKQPSPSENEDPVDHSQEGSDTESEVVDFKGPADPQNPYNWTKSKKWSHGAVLSVMAFVT